MKTGHDLLLWEQDEKNPKSYILVPTPFMRAIQLTARLFVKGSGEGCTYNVNGTIFGGASSIGGAQQKIYDHLMASGMHPPIVDGECPYTDKFSPVCQTCTAGTDCPNECPRLAISTLLAKETKPEAIPRAMVVVRSTKPYPVGPLRHSHPIFTFAPVIT